MDNSREKSFSLLNVKSLRIIGILFLFISAAALVLHGNANSMQAEAALVAQVCFDGEYRIGDGDWHKIENGKHISATKGDVTLRGNFHILTPDGEYVGIYSGDMPIAFYTNHINLTFYEGENEPYIADMENHMYGKSSCGVGWFAKSFSTENTEPIEILIHNPHSYGNETAIDEMISRLAFWTGIDFEKSVLEIGDTQRAIGLLFIIISLMLLGTALFSTLIHVKKAKIVWILGATILFAGTYLSYSADGVSFWSESVVSNTTLLGLSMMFYMLFISVALVSFLNRTRNAGKITVMALAAIDIVFFLLPIFTDVFFYDTWLYWAIAQMTVNFVFLCCVIKEIYFAKGKKQGIYIGLILPIISFGIDFFMIYAGIWRGGIASVCVFIIFFAVAMITVLKIIPHSINVISKAKELETEKIVLNARLTESRVSTMMSQIRPHFIYNTLGSIEQLCNIDPSKAGELVHNFAKYLRGNFRELDNPKPILMSQEIEHVRHYVSIENVRFPDMTFSFEMKSIDFKIPAFTIQPLVENAIKHGLMKLSKGGTIRVVSYETENDYCVSVEDNGAGFDTGVLLDERKHVGIRNIRGRLEAMVNGRLEIESACGVGTKVLISIPKKQNEKQTKEKKVLKN